MDQQLIGRTLLGCRIQSVIGRGAAGTVFLARHLQIDCLRAIKVLKPELASDRNTVERFRSEARSAASIRHENLVSLHNAEEGDGYFAYVMEYVEGQTLTQRVQRDGPLAPPEAVDLLLQACAGLAAAHHAGITHRDIKPENLLLTASGQLKVADFGLARAADSQQLTQQGQASGTPPYMSPEQCMSQPIDPRSDLYSLGLVGYYLLTGSEPMLGTSVMATMFNQVNKVPDPPHLLRQEIGEALSEVICRMLAKSPAQRQPDAETVIDELWAALETAPQSTDHILQRSPAVRPILPPANTTGTAPQLLRYLPSLLLGLLAGWLLQTQSSEQPRPAATPAKQTAPAQPDLIPDFIRALERDDQAAAFDVLSRHLDRHPRDWEMRSKRIALARQLARILEAFPDLLVLESADQLSDLETDLLIDIYRKQGQSKQAAKLLMARTLRDPRHFDWLTLADWFAADPRRVEPLPVRLLEMVLTESRHAPRWQAVGRASAKALRAKDRKRALALANRAGEMGSSAISKKLDIEAVQHFTRCLLLIPGASTVQYRLRRARAYSRLGQHTRAHSDYTEVARFQPGHALVAWHMTMQLSGRGQYKQAIRNATVAIRRSRPGEPSRADLFLARGVACLLAKRPKMARSDFKRAISIRAHLLLYFCEALVGAELGEAFGLSQLNTHLPTGRGRIMVSTGSYRAWVQVGSRLIALLPNHPFAHAERGNVHLLLGNRAAAIRDLKRAFELCVTKYAKHAPLIKQALARAQALPRQKKR